MHSTYDHQAYTNVLDKEAGYQLDLGRIQAAITKKTVAILVNSPGNPSGAVYAQDERFAGHAFSTGVLQDFQGP